MGELPSPVGRGSNKRGNMQRSFGGGAFEPVDERRDKELTLGPTMLVALACGLLVLCGLCFVFGYAVGHRSGGEGAAATVPGLTAQQAQALAATAQPKPSAAQGGSQLQPGNAADESNASAAELTPVASGQSTATPAQSAVVATPSGGSAAVQSALPAQAMVPAAVPGGGAGVAPALSQAGTIMVQIAAVSHPEDAQVLVGALRKRGYAVTARHDPVDGMLHVQIGPFKNRDDANAMRTKLLNDGYNAIVQ